MTMTDYDKTAIDFLMSNKIQMKTKYIKHDLYFADDKEARDIYRITLWRDGKRFSIRYGQSLKRSSGFGHLPPTAYDVLTCLTKSDPGSFSDFCGDFGYDEDSRRAEKTYKAVCKEWEKVSGFFTETELEQLAEIY